MMGRRMKNSLLTLSDDVMRMTNKRMKKARKKLKSML